MAEYFKVLFVLGPEHGDDFPTFASTAIRDLSFAMVVGILLVRFKPVSLSFA